MATTTHISRSQPPQSFLSSYAPRLRQYNNALIAPLVQPPNVIAPIRTTKRGTTAINYAEDGYDDDDFDGEDGASRPRQTGLRSVRREEPSTTQTGLANANAQPPEKQLGRPNERPIELQGIWRDWMGRPKVSRTPRQCHMQTMLPSHLVPIRIDVDVPPFRPEAALPLPKESGAVQMLGIDTSLGAYRQGDLLSAPLRVKDQFLWNLHESLITPDQFAKSLVEELDLPAERRTATIMDINRQIREQLEQYANVALNPLWSAEGERQIAQQEAVENERRKNYLRSLNRSLHPTSARPSSSARNTPGIGAASTPQPQFPSHLNGQVSTPGRAASTPQPSVTATASQPSSHPHNPPDAYRTILTLSLNLSSKLYTDRIEWSLIHPPGHAEAFARLTCADLGLPGEWVAAISHAIHDAVYKQKKEIVENNGLLPGAMEGNLDNDSVDFTAEAGWRYDPEGLCGVGWGQGYAGAKRKPGEEWGGSEWEPKVEALSKEEIEKREGDRERSLRRMRRETGKVSELPGRRGGGGGNQSDYFSGGLGTPVGGQSDYFANGLDETTERLGRGERKKKRRLRSASPSNRDTPEQAEGAASGEGFKTLTDTERKIWRCTHCSVWGSAVWAVRDGPRGPKSLCMNCGVLWERDGRLPECARGIFALEVGVGGLGVRGR
ncbi:MAG: hypothetical protein Q9162_001555 [Coniocarpon cinnabarinum]